MIDRALRAAARLAVRHAPAVAVALVAVTAGAAWLAPRFSIEPDVAAMFPEGHESVELFEATRLGERTARTLYVALRGEDLGARLPALLDRLEASPYLVEVAGTREALSDGRTARAREAPLDYLPEDVLDALEERLAPAGRRAAIAESKNLLAEDPLLGREVVLRDPLGLRWLIDEGARRALPASFDPSSPYLLLDGGRLAFLRLVGARDPYDLAYSVDLLADVEGRLADFDGTDAEGRARRIVVGGYATARADAERIRGDLLASVLGSLPLIFLFLAVSMRSLASPLLVVLPIALAVFWTLTYGNLALGPLNPLSAGAAAILTGLGVDFTIHYLTRFREERAGSSYAAAIETAHVHTGRALFAGMGTTVVAFLSFAFGSFHGLRSFGLLLSLGLVLSFASTLLFLPLLLRRARGQPPASSGTGTGADAGPAARDPSVGFVTPLLLGVGRSRAGRPLAGALVLLSLAGWVGVASRGLFFDADPTRLRPDDEPVVEAARQLRGELGFSPIPILALVPRDVSVDALAEAVDGLREDGWIRFADGAPAVLPTTARTERVAELRERTRGWVDATLGDLGAAGFRPDSLRATLEEQAELLDADAALPPEELADLELDWRGRRYWLITLYPIEALSDPGHRPELHAAVHAAFGDTARVLDPYSLADDLAPLLAADLGRAVEISAVLVVAIVVGLIGGAGAGLFALLPVVVGLGIVLGGLALLRIPLHPGNFIAIPLILGLGVDDGIHMVLRSREHPGEAGLRHTAAAVWRTSVTTALGFGSLVLAKSPAIASMGAIVLVGVLICYLASVWIVPVLLRSHEGP